MLRRSALPFSWPRKPSLIALLETAAQGRNNLKLSSFSEQQIKWGIETGVGPLFFFATKDDPEASVSPIWPLLQGANLTAQVICDEQSRAMEEIVDGCSAQGHTLTPIKGISICRQFYPEPHLRLMRDLDFLVQDSSLAYVEDLLVKLGYRQESRNPPEFYEQHHHTMPFFHPQKNLWVEIHRRLFPPQSRIGSEKLFSDENVKHHMRSAEFAGRTISRLSDELQAIYIACHWARDLHIVGGMIGMLDLTYLFSKTQGAFRWDQFLNLLQGSSASAYVYLMLSYLGSRDLADVPAEILRELFSMQQSLGRFTLKTMHVLIDQYLVEGKTAGIVLGRRNVRILWRTLLLPGPPLRNLTSLPWNLLPTRLRPKKHAEEAALP